MTETTISDSYEQASHARQLSHVATVEAIKLLESEPPNFDSVHQWLAESLRAWRVWSETWREIGAAH